MTKRSSPSHLAEIQHVDRGSTHVIGGYGAEAFPDFAICNKQCINQMRTRSKLVMGGHAPHHDELVVSDASL